MDDCPYRVQCVKEASGMAAVRESRHCSQTEEGENGGHLGTDAKKVSQVERAGNLEAEVPTNEVPQKFCLFFAKAELQLMNRRKTEEIKITIGLVSGANFDAGEICWHMKEVDDSKQMLDEYGDEKLSGGGSTNEIVKRRGRSSVSAAELYRKDALAVLLRHMPMSSLQDMFF